ncbi:transposase [Streptosporangium sp. NPDC051022]|uniref:transposase n=1 Tax=Streptosporangium sp. NPDC051022 TaxID=3155752 RepID=UPI0034326515
MDYRLKRDDLTEDEWVKLAPLLPAHRRRGHQGADHRAVINGVFFRNRAACSWRSLPKDYGNWKTVYNRHRRWSLDGTWDAILEALLTGRDETTGPERAVCTDPAVNRVHRPAVTRPTPPRDIRPVITRPAPPRDIRPGKMFEVANW